MLRNRLFRRDVLCGAIIQLWIFIVNDLSTDALKEGVVDKISYKCYSLNIGILPSCVCISVSILRKESSFVIIYF